MNLEEEVEDKLDGNNSNKNNLRLDTESLKSSKIYEENLKDRKKCKDFEEILKLVGSEGKFQKILLYGIVCPIITIAPFIVLNVLFMLDVPDHWCHVPGQETNISSNSWKNLTIPVEIGPDGLERFSQCQMYSPNSVNNVTECQFGWEYDRTDYDNTIPSEFNWVCDKLNYATDCFTWSTVGSAIGTVIFGILADKYGRKRVFFVSCFVNIFFRSVSLFLPQHFNLYIVFIFLGGTAFPALFTIPALIVAEFCSSEYRSWIYAVSWMIWVLGNSLLPLVAWATRGWFFFGVVAAIPGVFLFLYYPFIYESPLWLITVGRGDEALKIILTIAEVNGNRDKIDKVEIGKMVEDLLEKQKEDKAGRSIGVWTLFQHPRLATNTVILCIAMALNDLLYYGITLNTTSMSGNKFLNYFLLSIIELPSGYLAGIMVEKTGRRWTQSGFFLMCVISCIICAIGVANPEVSYFEILGALGIKFGVTITSLVVYIQATEIFPTQLRSTGSGLAATISSCAGITGPYIVFTGKVNIVLPYVILGLLSSIGLLASSCLPETFRQHLPETIEEANSFGKSQKFWSYLPKAKEDKERTP